MYILIKVINLLMAVLMKFPFYKQFDAMDCGPACLRMIAKHFGKNFSLQTLREHSFITREGVSLLGISDAAESIGMRTKGVRVSFSGLVEEVPLPCVAHWKQNHFVVVYKIKKNGKVFVADPAHGLINYSKKEFLQNWLSTKNQDENEGIVLIIEPIPDFHAFADEPLNKSSFSFLFSYLRPYKRFTFFHYTKNIQLFLTKFYLLCIIKMLNEIK